MAVPLWFVHVPNITVIFFKYFTRIDFYHKLNMNVSNPFKMTVSTQHVVVCNVNCETDVPVEDHYRFSKAAISCTPNPVSFDILSCMVTFGFPMSS